MNIPSLTHREILFDLQDGRCWICHQPMDLAAPWGHEFVTIDHFVPRSLGGTSELANKLVAHRRCNCSRGNQPASASRWAAVMALHAESP